MTTRLYLDTRGLTPDKEAPIKVSLNAFGSSAYIGTGIRVLPDQWDRKGGKVIKHPLKTRLNLELSSRKLAIDNAINELTEEGRLHGLKVSEIKDLVEERLDPGRKERPVLLMERFDAWTAAKTKTGTRVSYEMTAKKIRGYDPKAERLKFDDISRQWLVGFDAWMARTAPSVNARNIHLRNLRTVFNDAIDEGITSNYPFRKLAITPEPTKDRSLTRDDLRKLFSFPCSNRPQQEAVDIFQLVFLLCGINIGDLASVKTLNNGRIECLRMKTGQPISVSVSERAARIIDRYRGKDYLLNILDRYNDYQVYAHKVNDNLKRIGMTYNPHTKKWEGSALFPDLSLYWARYSWATMAAEIDIPERTIGSALAHSTRKSVTAIYTRNDLRKKITEAQTAVENYVFAPEICE